MSQLIRRLLFLSIFLLSTLAGGAFVSWQKDESLRWVQHTLEVLYLQSDLLSACQEATSTTRGYVLSKTPDFRNRYQLSAESIDRLTAQIEKLTEDNPSQQMRLQRLKEQTAQLRQRSGLIWRIAQTTTVPREVEALVAAQKQSMDTLSVTIKEIGDEEKRLLERRTKDAAHNEKLLGWFGGVLIAVAGGLLAFALKVENEESKNTKARLSGQEKAAQQERQLASIVRSVKDYAIFLLDPSGNIITWNQGAERLKGYTTEEAIGKNFSMFYPPEVAASGHPQNELVLALRDGRYEEEGWRVRKDGSRFWANVVITAVHEPDGRHVGFAKVTRDLTERKLAEEELTGARDKAVAVDEAKTRFLSTVSHEVRTPMAGVIGLVELIGLSAEQDENIRKLAEAALASCKRLLQILNDVLDVSRLQAGAVRLEYRRFAIRPVIGDLVQLASPEVLKKKLEIESRVADDVPEIVCGDELRVRQILQNLTFNAVKFTAEGKISLNVEVVKDGLENGAKNDLQNDVTKGVRNDLKNDLKNDKKSPFLKFTVSDTGIGIAPEDQEKLFQPFVQANDSTTRVYGGTGLGLSICRTLTSLMGGEIGVSSSPGKGSTFWVVIPFRDDQCQT